MTAGERKGPKLSTPALGVLNIYPQMPGEPSAERKAAVLRDLVQLYIRTGEPVGSEVLAQHRACGVSSATIRNELAALEEMGYLAQPHTVGRTRPHRPRLPLLRRHAAAARAAADPERRAIVQFFDEALADVDEILRGTTHLLSRLTRYASLALAPSAGGEPIARAELIRSAPGPCCCWCSTTAGWRSG